jgi:Fe-S oxidoreductase/predicted DNA-binding protein with PD1-like motif
MVMCPSYQATMDEEHSPRGRSRLLFEMLDGHGDSAIKDGWRSEAVRDALDLCLACKGCKSDCPVNVDIATYKAEFLAHHYKGRLRPRAHYALGWLPTTTALLRRLHLIGLANVLARMPILSKLATRAAGLAPREIPVFAGESLQQWWSHRARRQRGTRGKVMLWPDTFTNQFHPDVGKAAIEVLEHAGWEVELPPAHLCCGLTWISTGQLDTAKKRLQATIAALAEHLHAGGLVVGLEPSCLAVFRSDASELLGDDLDAERLRHQSLTLAELLLDHTPGWIPPKLGGVHGFAQVHCHQHAVLGWDADAKLLDASGAMIERLDSGCCGLAGNFGFEAGHFDISKACAEQVLLPSIRESSPDDVVLADGFSCRTQIHELNGSSKEALHLAELLARALRGEQASSNNEPRSGPAAVSLRVGAAVARATRQCLRKGRPRGDQREIGEQEMTWKLVDETEGRTYVLVASAGEDAIDALSALARDETLSAAQLTAVGAFARATVGWFDRDKKEYREIPVDQQCEVLSLVGDIALSDNGPAVHAHAVLGLSDGQVRGGHLLKGEVWPTLEVVIRESPATLRKTNHPEIGLALIDLERSGG